MFMRKYQVYIWEKLIKIKHLETISHAVAPDRMKTYTQLTFFYLNL